MTTTTKAQPEQEKEQARGYLRDYLKPGDRVYSTFIGYSETDAGVTRRYRYFYHSPSGIAHITHLVARATGYRWNKESRTVSVRSGDDTEITSGLGWALYSDDRAFVGERL